MSASADGASTRYDVLFLACLAFCFCVLGVGLGSLASWDEAFYARVSREIVRTGEWVHLSYAGAPFYDKPPLYFWATAFFYHLFGINEFASRLGSALAGVGVVLMTYFLGRRLLGRLAALAGAGVLLSSTDFLHYARWGTLDVSQLFFFTLAVLMYLKALERPIHWLGFWLASAGAVMTKGPIIVLAWGVVFFDCLSRQNFSFLKKKEFWLGLLLLAAAILPWHWAVYLKHPDLFMQGFFYNNYVSRASGALDGHTGGWYFHIRTLINKYHPWIVLAPAALPWAAWMAVKSPQKRGYQLLLFWTALVLAFFTFLVKTKLQWYILPLHPALSLLIGAFAAKVLFKEIKTVWLKGLIVAAALMQFIVGGVFAQDYAPAIKDLSGAVQSAVQADDTVFLYDYHDQPAASFYFDRKVAYADSLKELDEVMGSDERLPLIITKQKYIELVGALNERGFRKLAQTDKFKTDLVFLRKSPFNER